MKTKKVYSSFKAISVAFIITVSSFVMGSNPIDYKLMVCGFLFGIWTIFILYLRFKPCFSFNDEYLTVGEAFWKTENIKWEDILSISTNEYSGMTFIYSRFGHQIPMSFLITPNYFQTLKEIIDLLQKNNPNAEISDETFKRFNESYKKKQMYLLVLLLMLFLLIWAMVRFQWLAIH